MLSLLPLGTANAFLALYPTEASRAEIAATAAANPAFLTILGPIYGSSIGALTAWRVGTLTAVLVGLMATLTVVRHTRDEEESGRRELIGSTVVGRHAPLAAALIVTGLAGLLLGLLVAGGLIGIGLPSGGAVAFGLGLTGLAIGLAGVAAVASQLTEGAGAARGISIAFLGACFLLRAAGDGSQLEALSWVSPIGWYTRLRAFAQEEWLVLGLYLGLSAATVALAFVVSARRDVGAGIFPPRPGPAVAPASLRSPLGLATRLQRAAFWGWTAGLLTIAVVYGSVANSIGDFLNDSPQLRAIVEMLGGAEGITDAFFGAAMGILALIVSAYAIRTTLRLRVEEESLRAEPVLATATPRVRWALSHLYFALVGPIVMMALAGVVVGAVFGASIGDVGGQIARVFPAALIQVPAIWVVVGLTAALFGILPQQTSVSWGILVAFLVIGQLGQILQFPQWIRNFSPFTHVPILPIESLALTPLLSLLAVSAALLVAGMVGLQRRDLG
jgi:ABC-2 type transport system permease protein